MSVTALKICTAISKELLDKAQPGTLSESGDKTSQFLIGHRHEETCHFVEAVAWYKVAAEQDHIDAQYHLAEMYEKGFGVSKDQKIATEWYMRAAKQGFLEAQIKIAQRCSDGIGVKSNEVAATKWYKKAAEQGHLESQTELALRYSKGIGIELDQAAASNWYLKAAEGGHLEAQIELSHRYSQGIGLKIDEEAATFWLRKAVLKHDARAQYELAVRLEKGVGIVKKTEDVVKKAADKEIKPIFYLENGLGIYAEQREVMDLYMESAKQGYNKAKVACASKMLEGVPTEREKKNAFKLYWDAALQNHIAAQCIVARMYLEGIGIEKDESEAFNWYEKAAKNGDVAAQYNMALMLSKGQGTEKNEKEAVKWIKIAANNGNASAQFSLAFRLENEDGVTKNEQEAVHWYQLSAKNGDPRGHYRLFLLYEQGKWLEENPRLAIWHLKYAAKHGHVLAQLNLGIKFEKGLGLKKQEDKEYRAYYWFLEAATQGNSLAQCKVAWMLTEGIGTDVNYQEAFQWYQKAAEEDENPYAQCGLAWMLHEGFGVERDEKAAYYWYQKAANQGNAYAQHSLGIMLMFGIGHERNMAEALDRFKKAADQGYVIAQLKLAKILSHSFWTEKDEKVAFELFQKAANQKNPQALFHLGQCYELGAGTTKNIKRAVKLYRQSAKLGNFDAKQVLNLRANLKRTKSELKLLQEEITRQDEAIEPPQILQSEATSSKEALKSMKTATIGRMIENKNAFLEQRMITHDEALKDYYRSFQIWFRGVTDACHHMISEMPRSTQIDHVDWTATDIKKAFQAVPIPFAGLIGQVLGLAVASSEHAMKKTAINNVAICFKDTGSRDQMGELLARLLTIAYKKEIYEAYSHHPEPSHRHIFSRLGATTTDHNPANLAQKHCKLILTEMMKGSFRPSGDLKANALLLLKLILPEYEPITLYTLSEDAEIDILTLINVLKTVSKSSSSSPHGAPPDRILMLETIREELHPHDLTAKDQDKKKDKQIAELSKPLEKRFKLNTELELRLIQTHQEMELLDKKRKESEEEHDSPVIQKMVVEKKHAGESREIAHPREPADAEKSAASTLAIPSGSLTGRRSSDSTARLNPSILTQRDQTRRRSVGLPSSDEKVTESPANGNTRKSVAELKKLIGNKIVKQFPDKR